MNKKLKTIIAGCVILTTSIGGIQIIKSMNNQLTYKEVTTVTSFLCKFIKSY